MTTEDHWLLYPDIQAAGGLGPALAAEFARLGGQIGVHGFGSGSCAWAVPTQAEGKSRRSRLSLATEERLFQFDFWADDVEIGWGTGKDLTPVAETVVAWLTQGLSAADMEDRFPLFVAAGGTREFETGDLVEYAWAKLDRWAARDWSRMTPLIEAAKRRPELRQLLPFTSHESLCFSRCTGYPYTNDVAHAVPLEDGQYRALGPGYVMQEKTYRDHRYREAEYDVLGEGDAEHVIGLIVAALPPDCGPAVTGTARNSEGL